MEVITRDGISVKPIYRHFLKYRLSVSVKVRTDKISAIGYGLGPNINSEHWLNNLMIFPDISAISRIAVPAKPITDKISVIGNRLW